MGTLKHEFGAGHFKIGVSGAALKLDLPKGLSLKASRSTATVNLTYHGASYAASLTPSTRGVGLSFTYGAPPPLSPAEFNSTMTAGTTAISNMARARGDLADNPAKFVQAHAGDIEAAVKMGLMAQRLATMKEGHHVLGVTVSASYDRVKRFSFMVQVNIPLGR